jgi:hypothetical protein
MFRAPTTRTNIAYQVRESGPDSVGEVMCQVVREKLAQYAAPGKIIVYSSKITEAEKLAEELGCPVYHRHVDDSVGKAQRMRGWIDGDHRVIVVDGRDDRVRCEEGEERCNVCCEDQRAMEELAAMPWTPNDEPFDDSGIAVESSQVSMRRPDQVQEQLDDRFEQQQRHRQWQRRQLVHEQQDEAIEVSQFRQQLEQWVNRCALCHLQGRREQQHRLEDYQHPDIDVVLEAVATMITEIQSKKRFAAFSCCYRCGVPQAICQRWRQQEEQGWFEEDTAVRCQYPRVVIPVVAVILKAWHSHDTDIIHTWMKNDMVDTSDIEEQFRWFGRKVMWGGIEVSNLCQVFYRFVSMVDLD